MPWKKGFPFYPGLCPWTHVLSPKPRKLCRQGLVGGALGEVTEGNL